MLSALFTLLGTLSLCIVAMPKQVKQEVGDDVTLMPNDFINASEICWKKAGNKLVDMDIKKLSLDISYYSHLDRMSFGLTDGSLTIRNLIIEDSGNYTAEVTFGASVKKTNITLTVLESRGPSGGDIILRIIGVLALIGTTINLIILLWYYCCKKPRPISETDIAGIAFWVLALITTIITNILLLYYYCRKSSGPSGVEIILYVVFGVYIFITIVGIILLFRLLKYYGNIMSRPLSVVALLLIVVSGVLSPFALLTTIFLLRYYCCKRNAQQDEYIV